MGVPVIIVPSGGLPVSISTNGYGLPVTLSTNGYGMPITQAVAGYGLPVVGVSFGPTIELSAFSVLETAPINTTVGTLSLTPGTTGTPVYSLVDSAGGKFNILGTALRTNALLDYETATAHSITIAVSGVTPAVPNRTVPIIVIDVAEPVIALTGTTMNENAPIGVNIGTLSVVNAYTGTPTYTLVDNAGGKVAISGALLNVAAAVDYETTPSFNITVAVSGITPAAANKVFTVAVLDVEESGGAYVGPGDIKPGALGWWGLRAYSAAQCTGSVKAIQVVKDSDGSAPTDINITTAGALDVAAISALGYAVRVNKIYDQVGTRHFEALTSVGTPNYALGPTINLTGIGGARPCLVFAAATRQEYTAGFGAIAQPYTISMIYNRTSSSGAYETYLSPNAVYGLLGNNVANGVLMYTGGNLAVTTVADNVVHTGQYVFNGATGFSCVDGVSATMDIGNTTGWAAGAVSLGNNRTQTSPVGQWVETGFWASAFSAGDATAMDANQQDYLAGTGGGGTGVTKNIVMDYGAVGDAQWAQTTLSITTNVLTSATPIWSSGDVGKSIVVGKCGGTAGAPGGGSALITTIAGYTSPTQITLGKNAVSTMTSEPNVIVAWGTSSSTAFDDCRTDLYGMSDVTLTIPAGNYLIAGKGPGDDNFGGLWDGIKEITVNATGATIAGGTFAIYGFHQQPAAGYSGYANSVSAGASSVTLITPADAAKFTVGGIAMMTGFGLQFQGYPTNHQRIEYLRVANITGSMISFSTPLANSYLSTWPLYDGETISPSKMTSGGPATLYAMHQNFNHTAVINGMTIAHHAGWQIAGLDLTFNDCVFAGLWGPNVTMARSLVFNDTVCTLGTMEADKNIPYFEMTGCTWGGLAFQSASITSFVLDGSDIINSISGVPCKTTIRNGSTVGTVGGIGRLAVNTQYGLASELNVSNSAIREFGFTGGSPPNGYVICGTTTASAGVNADFTMTAGVIRIPSSSYSFGYVEQWPVTGGKLFFYDPNVGTIGSFTITDVTQDGSAVYVHTNRAGTWPVRTYGPSGLRMVTHPAPICTFSSATGCPEVVDLSGAPAGAPLYSYSKRTFTDLAQTGRYWEMWGRFKYIKVIVTTPYAGGTFPGAVTATLMNSNNSGIKAADGTATTAFIPIIDLRVAGTRTFDATAGSYPVNWTSTAVGASDTLPAQTEALWCGGNYIVQMTDISTVLRPFEFSIEFITDQGF